MAEDARLLALSASFTAIGSRIGKLEQACAGTADPSSVDAQFMRMDARLSKLETLLGVTANDGGAHERACTLQSDRSDSCHVNSRHASIMPLFLRT